MSVCIATDYWVDGRDFISGSDKNFFLPHSVEAVLGLTQPRIQWIPGTLSQE
jgi:hypothetical protein